MHLPQVFAWIADAGSVSDDEMLRTFNCGVGMVLVVAPEHQAEVSAVPIRNPRNSVHSDENTRETYLSVHGDELI